MWPKRYLIHDSAIEAITERVESDGDYEEAFNSIEKNLIREHSPDLIRSNMDVRFPEDGASMINLLKRDGVLRCKLDCFNLTIALLSGEKMLVGCDYHGVCVLHSRNYSIQLLLSDEGGLRLSPADATYLTPMLQIMYQRVFTYRYGDVVDEARFVQSDSVHELSLTWQKDDDTVRKWEVMIFKHRRLDGTFIGIFGVGALIAFGSDLSEDYMVEKLSMHKMKLPKHIITDFYNQLKGAMKAMK